MPSQPFLPKPKRPKLFLLRRVVGDSMLPTLAAGRVVVAVRPRRLRAGDVVVVRHGNLEKIKRLQEIKLDKVFIVGDNPHHSTDSRDFGWLPTRAVIAKVIWPKQRAKVVY